MPKTRMHDIAAIGQSLWIDNISRSMITSGRLKSLIDQGLRGQTSNPTIFKQAISASNDYDVRILQLAEAGKSTFDIYDELTIKDVQDAADLFKDVYEQTKGLDGYVSLEINPKLGREREVQFTEGVRLWKKLGRPNVMIKVPSTKNGCLVVEDLIAEGINVNATLIFSAEQYQQVAWSYLKGLGRLAQKGGDLKKVRSVASVFVSRIDASVDKWLDEKKAEGKNGRAAVHNCEIVFHKFNQTFSSNAFKELQAKGANAQRVLWASTGTKDARYSDVKYITELIANPTVNTLPEKTLEAFLDHGTVQAALPGDVAKAQQALEELRGLGMDVSVLCLKLLDDGLLAFEQSFDELTSSIEEKTKKLCAKG